MSTLCRTLGTTEHTTIFATFRTAVDFPIGTTVVLPNSATHHTTNQTTICQAIMSTN